MGHEWRDDYFEAVRDDRQNADDWSWGQQTFHSSVNGLLYWKEWVWVHGMIERVREESEDQKGFAIHLSGLPLGRV